MDNYFGTFGIMRNIVSSTVLLHKELEIPTLHSKFFELLKFVVLSEVEHISFWVKFSGLIRKLRILENHIKVREYSSYRLKFGLFLKLNKNYGAPLKNSELFCFKDKKNFAALFFVAAGNKKGPAGKCAAIRAYVANKSTR